MAKKKLIQAGLLAVCALFIVYGAAKSEYRTVFMKAVNICLECIGIG